MPHVYLLCGLAVLAPVVLALQPTQAAAQAQLAPVQRAPTYERQQKRINAWTVGLAASLTEGAPSRPAVEVARFVDDGTNLLVLPIVASALRRGFICAAPIWRRSLLPLQ